VTHFIATFFYDSGVASTNEYTSFSEFPVDLPFWKRIEKVELVFTPAVPDTPLHFAHLQIENGDHILYANKEKIEIKEGFLQEILLASHKTLWDLYKEFGKEKNNDMLKYFENRNNRLFELFGHPVKEEELVDNSVSWAPAMVALAAAGLLGALKKRSVEQKASKKALVEEGLPVEVKG